MVTWTVRLTPGSSARAEPVEGRWSIARADLLRGMAEPQTIFALSSAPGRAGIAVVRVSGPGAGDVVDALAPPRPKDRVAGLRRIRDPQTGEIIDEGLVLWFAAPRTETGEDMAEFHLHGGPAIVKAVLAALARQAVGRRDRLGVAKLGRRRGGGRTDPMGSPAARRKAYLQVSMEQNMGCAVGACLGCVVMSTSGTPQRVCREGPVFAADEIAWEGGW